MFKFLKVIQLSRKLKDKNSDIRKAAAEVLGRLGSTLAVKPLIKALGDSDGDVRQAATESLGQLGDARAVEPLIKALEAPYSIRSAAAKALGYLRDARAVEPLIKALEDSDIKVRTSVAEALGQLGNARAVEPLIKALGDSNMNVRGSAAQALGQLGEPQWSQWVQGDCKDLARLGKSREPRAVEPLVKALGDSDNYVRRAAAEALDQFGGAPGPLLSSSAPTSPSSWGQSGGAHAVGPLIKALGDRDEFVRRPAAEALGRLGAGAVEPMIKALGNSPTHVRPVVAKALGRLGDARAAEPLIKALEKHNTYDDRHVHQAAAGALGQLGDARAVEPLIKALGDFDNDVRRAAARALGKLGDARAIGTLIKALGDKSNVRTTAAVALSELGEPQWSQWVKGANEDFSRLASSREPRALAPLIEALRNSDEYDHYAAAEALGQLGDARGIEHLIKVLAGSNDYIRKAAANTLGQLGDARAVEPLFQALKGGMAAAAQALGQLGDAHALLTAQETGDRNVQKAAADALEHLDTRAVKSLIKALGDREWKVRKAAAGVLGHLGQPQWSQWIKGDQEDFLRLGTSRDPICVELLIETLGKGEFHSSYDAAKALGQSGDPRAVQPLIKALSYRGVFVPAALSLGQLGDARAVEPLVGGLRNLYKEDRGAAATALFMVLSRHPSLRIPNASAVIQAIREPHTDEHSDGRQNKGATEHECHADHWDFHSDKGIGMEIPAELRATDF